MKHNVVIIGWREWLALPLISRLSRPRSIPVRVTQPCYAFGLEPFKEGGTLKVRFGIYPLQRRKDIELNCVADVVDRRRVTSSDGQSEMRHVIRTSVAMGELKK